MRWSGSLLRPSHWSFASPSQEKLHRLPVIDSHAVIFGAIPVVKYRPGVQRLQPSEQPNVALFGSLDCWTIGGWDALQNYYVPGCDATTKARLTYVIANLQKMAVAERREAEATTGRRNEVGLAVRQATIELLAESCCQ